MALTTCVDCGREHSTEAAACPQCGRLVQTTAPLPPAPAIAAPTPTPVGLTPSTSYEIAGIIAVLGGLAIVVGAFLPWAKVDAGFIARSASGVDGDGKITIIAGAAAVLFALIGLVRRPASGVMILLVLIASGLAAAVAAYDLSNVSDRVADINASTSVVHASTGAGLYVTLIGGGIGLVGALMSLQNRQPAP
jgi:hypothetical protein